MKESKEVNEKRKAKKRQFKNQENKILLFPDFHPKRAYISFPCVFKRDALQTARCSSMLGGINDRENKDARQNPCDARYGGEQHTEFTEAPNTVWDTNRIKINIFQTPPSAPTHFTR